MIIKRIIGVVCILLILALCACTADTAQAELSKTIEIPGTGLSISVPEDWDTYDKNYDGEFWVMSVSDADTAYADIFFTNNVEYDYSAEQDIESLESYYGDNIIDSTEKLQINDMTAYRFEYAMVDLGEDGDEYSFHGYEYSIDTPGGELEIDIYYSQSKLTAKIFDPSDSQLELLGRIAESLQQN